MARILKAGSTCDAKKNICKAIANHGQNTVKPVLSGHSEINKTKVLKTNGSLIKVESIAECSKRAFCNTYYLY